MKRSYNFFRRVSAVLIGLCFVLSGVSKLLDVTGTALIMEEYFRFFHITFMIPLAKVSGFALSMFEALLGTTLVCGVWRKPVIHIATGVILFFTIITLILWIKKPLMDCGCFGEVIHLTHGETLVKNLALLVLALFSLLPRMDYGVPKRRKYVTFSLGCLLVLYFGLYGIWNIPLVDLTPFRPNVRLMQAVVDEEDPSISMYQNVFVYEKDGRQEYFTIENMPDSTWTYVEAMSVENQELTESPDLPLTSLEGEMCSSKVCQGRVIVQSVYGADAFGAQDWARAACFVGDCKAVGFTPFILVASGYEQLRQRLISLGLYENLKDYVYSSDHRTLMSLNRSNGGYTYIDNGLLIAKCSVYDRPDRDDLEDFYQTEPLDTLSSYEVEGRIGLQLYYLLLLVVLLF